MSIDREIKKKQEEIKKKLAEEKARKEREEALRREYARYNMSTASPVRITPWPGLMRVINEVYSNLSFKTGMISHTFIDGSTRVRECVSKERATEKAFYANVWDNGDTGKDRKSVDIFIFPDRTVAFEGDSAHCYSQAEAAVRAKLIEAIAASRVNKQGCYIASAVYGSYDCPEVWILRRYRDGYLKQSIWGRLFIRCYYAISPSIVKVFGKNATFNNLWRRYLSKRIIQLRKQGYSDKEYVDE